MPLGSPKNTFGTGDLLSGSNRENFWAAVNGYCAGHESGDLKLTRYESYSTSTGGAAQCNNGSAQTGDYDPNGYLYAIEMPQAQLALRLEIYDGSYNTSGSTPDLALAAESQAVTTVVQVFGADNTPRTPATTRSCRPRRSPPTPSSTRTYGPRCTRGSTRPPAPTTSG